MPTYHITGNAAAAEFAPLLTLLRGHGDLQAVTLPAEAELLVVLQDHPDAHSADDVDALLRANPLARVMVVAGTWSASDGRTRSYWPPAFRVPLALAPARLSAEIGVLLHEGRSAWPWTSTREAVMAIDYDAHDWPSHSAIAVAIDSPDRACEGLWRGLVVTAGCRVVPLEQATVLLLDLDPANCSVRQDQVTRVLAMVPKGCAIGLTGEPAPVTDTRLCTIIEKLAPAAQLIYAIGKACPPAATQPTEAGSRQSISDAIDN